MKLFKHSLLPLIIALMVALMPISIAKAANGSTEQRFGSALDYTGAHWAVEGDKGQRVELNSDPGQAVEMTIEALPGSAWDLSVEFVRVRNSRLVPFDGDQDVTRHCVWTPGANAPALSGMTATLPEAEGIYKLTGTFTDDEGNTYTCVFAFDVSADHIPEPTERPLFSASDGGVTVEQKVAQVAAKCRSAGVTSDYDIALWLHDWLIYHATYDYSSEPVVASYHPEGILLNGRGVCQGYSEAYGLLLDAFNIPNQMVTSQPMNHGWNLVKLDGNWVFVDCTWDDPGTGGNENHYYFGMNSALLGRNHTWTTSSYPSSTTLNYYYPLREGKPCYTTEDELNAILTDKLNAKATSITVTYTGTSSSHNTWSLVSDWMQENLILYGVNSYSIGGQSMGFGFYATLSVKYSSSSGGSGSGDEGGGDEGGGSHGGALDVPKPSPKFSINGPSGNYSSSSYNNNGLAIVFGDPADPKTQSLMGYMYDNLNSLYGNGTAMIWMMNGTEKPSDLAYFQQNYPNIQFAYMPNGDLMWAFLRAVGFEEDTTEFPCVFVIDEECDITYYDTGETINPQNFLAAALAVGTGNDVPEPETHTDLEPMLNAAGNVNDIEDGGSVVAMLQQASESGNVIFLMDSQIVEIDKRLLNYFEAHYSMYAHLNISLIASINTLQDGETATYPHCTFIDFSQSDFWKLLEIAGHVDLTQAYYTTNMLIAEGGDIVAFTNGDVLDPSNCALHSARKVSYNSTIPAGLTEIGPEAFTGTGFRNIDLTGGSLQIIRSGAFAHCDNLEFLRIPESVTTIEVGAFEGTDVTIYCIRGSEAYRFAADSGMNYICD